MCRHHNTRLLDALLRAAGEAVAIFAVQTAFERGSGPAIRQGNMFNARRNTLPRGDFLREERQFAALTRLRLLRPDRQLRHAARLLCRQFATGTAQSRAEPAMYTQIAS